MSARAADDYVRVSINVFGGFSDGPVAACVSRIAIYGLGHILSLPQHSPDTAALMHSARAPRDRERRSVEVLYPHGTDDRAEAVTAVSGAW